MSDKQNIPSALPEFSFGFGNVRVQMREEEGAPKEEVFLGLSGTYTLSIKTMMFSVAVFPVRTGRKSSERQLCR